MMSFALGRNICCDTLYALIIRLLSGGHLRGVSAAIQLGDRTFEYAQETSFYDFNFDIYGRC